MQPHPSQPQTERLREMGAIRVGSASGQRSAAAGGRQCWMAVAAVLVGAGWGSNQFTPMLLVYRHALGLGAGSLEAMFGVYALGLIPGLFLAGPLSDARGRRLPVLGAATASLVGSLLLIAGARSPALLYVGRFVVGLGSGAAFSAGTAWLRELSLLAPGNADSARAARRAAVAMTTGFAVGPLVSGLLAQWGPATRVLPYLPHVAFMVATLFAAARLAPETITRRRRLSLGAGLPAGQPRRRFWRSVAVIAPWVFAAPAVAFAFLPAAIGADRLTGGVAVTGAVTALTALAGVLIQPAARALDALRWRWSVGMIGLLVCAAGLVLSAYAVAGRFAVAAGAVRCSAGLRLRAVPGLRADRGRAPSTSRGRWIADLGLLRAGLSRAHDAISADAGLAAGRLSNPAADRRGGSADQCCCRCRAGRPAANAAVDDRDREALPDKNGVVLDAAG